MTDFAALIRTLVDSEVECILVGGVAAIVHGSARLTRDVDVVYARTPANIDRLVAALEPYSPYLRGAPPGLPFAWDARTISRGLNFTLTTTLGDIDLLGEITGGGGFDQLQRQSQVVRIFDRDVRCLGLEGLIHTKRAAGRPRDLEAVAETGLRDKVEDEVEEDDSGADAECESHELSRGGRGENRTCPRSVHQGKKESRPLIGPLGLSVVFVDLPVAPVMLGSPPGRGPGGQS